MSALDQLVARDVGDPHAILGAHPAGDGRGVVVRAYRPGADGVRVHPEGGAPIAAQQVHAAGVFEAQLPGTTLPLRYGLEVTYGTDSYPVDDPYRFAPTLGEMDLHLAGEGRHEELYEKLGAHVREVDGVPGTSFAVWAPAARSVSVVGDFNVWDGRLHPMRSLGSSGIWELFVPGVGEGALYKFEIRTPAGDFVQHADPYAFATEHPPRPPRSCTAATTSGATASGWPSARSASRCASR